MQNFYAPVEGDTAEIIFEQKTRTLGLTGVERISYMSSRSDAFRM